MVCRVCMSMYEYVCTCTVCMYVCMYVCMLCMYVCMYVCILLARLPACLIDWLTGWLIDWLIDLVWLIDWLIAWLIDWVIGWSIWLIDWLVGWLVDWFWFDWLIDWLVGWLVGWLIDICTTVSSSSKYCNWRAILQSECRACLLARSFTWHLSLPSWRCWASTQVLLVQCCSTCSRSCFVLFMFFLTRQRNNRYDRRKFRSQTSDNMDRWKSRGGKSQRREEKRREEKKKDYQKEKVSEERSSRCPKR